MTSEDESLVTLGRALLSAGYKFVVVSPASHRRVVGRPGRPAASSLRDVFGWSLPFEHRLLPPEWVELLGNANVLEQEGNLLRSSVAFSTVGENIYAHSAYPAPSQDAVEIEPDSAMFASVLRRSGIRAERAVDVGCGAGVGGLSIAGLVHQLVLADVNPRALRFARVNASIGGHTRVEFAHSDVLADVTGSLDLVVAHPPHLVDTTGKHYRNGGGPLGIEASVRVVKDSLEKLAPGGRLLLYTSTPIQNGEDALAQAIQPILGAYDATYEYMEVDPDAYSEELEKPQYAQVERIARVALSAVLPGN